MVWKVQNKLTKISTWSNIPVYGILDHANQGRIYQFMVYSTGLIMVENTSLLYTRPG